jgi:hypothetical protein
MRHYLYLKLDANLAAGTYTIEFPAGTGLADYQFTFNDKVTRCSSIHGNQVGYRPSDVCKDAYLSVWVPGAPNEGQIEFPVATYPEFHLIDNGGKIVYTGSLTQRVSPTTVEASHAAFTATITGASNTNPVVLTVASHPFSAGNNVYISGVGGMTEINGFAYRISATTATSITLQKTDGTGWGTFTSGGTISGELNRYASTSTAPLTLVSISRADPGVVTYDGAAFIPAVGDTLMLRSVAGMTQLEGAFVRVLSVNTVSKTFTIDYDTSAYTAYSTSYLTAAIYKTHRANRAGTYVYYLDISAATNLVSGLYRYYIPGLGVSDQFRYDDAVYHDVNAITCGGIFNNRSGMALNGEFSYTRPVCFKDGVANGTALEIYYNYMPSVLASESGNGGGLASGLVFSAPGTWVSSERVPEGWGFLHHNAGDWDAHLVANMYAYYDMLDLGWDFLPANVRAVDFGTPKSSVTIGALYAGTDSLGDAVHEVLWAMEGYRQLQKITGAVGSGSSALPQTTGTAVSWVCCDNASIHAPDHPTNYAYAALAAKLAIIFAAEGLTSLATLWETSAVSAWDWAEDTRTILTGHVVTLTGGSGTYSNGETITGGTSGTVATVWASGTTSIEIADASGAFTVGETITGGTSGAARTYSSIATNVDFDPNYYYESELGVKTKAAWSTATFYTNLRLLRSLATTHRPAAAGVLWRLTGNTAYRDIVEAAISPGAASGFHQRVAAWEHYQQNPSPSARYYSDLTSAFPNQIADFSQATVAYRHNGTKGVNGTVGLFDQWQHLLRQFIITGSTDVLETLQAANNVISGANQYEHHLTSGVGVRRVEEFLHEDTKSSGQPIPPGYQLYAWQPGFFASALNFTSEAPINYIFEHLTGEYAADYDTAARLYEPYRLSVPTWSFIAENRLWIYQMEFTWHQSCVPKFIIGLWLHGHDGNVVTEAPTYYIQRTVTCAAA